MEKDFVSKLKELQNKIEVLEKEKVRTLRKIKKLELVKNEYVEFLKNEATKYNKIKLEANMSKLISGYWEEKTKKISLRLRISLYFLSIVIIALIAFCIDFYFRIYII